MPIAIADLHGRADLLHAALADHSDRKFVLLGDYVDRGPDSAQVLTTVRGLVQAGRAVALLGNHDQMMIDVLVHGDPAAGWLEAGGQETIDSYLGDWAAARLDALWMQEHLRPWHVRDHVLFAHALRPHPTLPTDTHLWGRPDGGAPMHALPDGCTHSVHGHTPVTRPTAHPAATGAPRGSSTWGQPGPGSSAPWTRPP